MGKYLNPQQLSDLLTSQFGLGTSVKQLSKLRNNGKGPEFHYWGKKIVYDYDDVKEWVDNYISPAYRFTGQAICYK